MTQEQVRYWPRVGMPVNYETALMLCHKMANDGTDIGIVMDDDIDEFQTVGGAASEENLKLEVEALFSRDQTPDDTQIDEDITWMLKAMEFEKQRKSFILEKKKEGMTLDEAKAAYEAGKADIVRQALNLPDEPMAVPETYDNLDEEGNYKHNASLDGEEEE